MCYCIYYVSYLIFSNGVQEQDEVNYLQDLVSHVNNKLRGFQVDIVIYNFYSK